VTTGALNQAVKRNAERFPDDFMFQLSKQEMENWKSHIVISNRERMGLRKPPLAFTDYGVLMLSSVLKSERAAQVNIRILRVFTRLRELLATHVELRQKIEEHDHQKIKVIYESVRTLLTPPKEPPRRRIGFGVEQ